MQAWFPVAPVPCRSFSSMQAGGESGTSSGFGALPRLQYPVGSALGRVPLGAECPACSFEVGRRALFALSYGVPRLAREVLHVDQEPRVLPQRADYDEKHDHIDDA